MSRFDAVGFFWEDVATVRGGPIKRVMPAIPETGWRPPTEYPDLSRARTLSIDTETYDPELEENGPGWARGKGHIVGVSVGANDGGRWYFPMRHEVCPEDNLNPETTLAWLRDTLGNPVQPKVGANLTYDVGWLKHEGVTVAGDLVDIQYAEALLNERSKVALELLGLKYLGEGKDTSILYQWCADFYGGALTNQRKNIYRAPPCLVGPYAESDADLPLRIAPLMYHALVRENLLELFQMECGLIPLMVAMRFKGVRVDIKKAEELQVILAAKEAEEQAKLDHLVGFKVETTKPDSIARAFDSLGFPYSKTALGKPSFTKKFMEDVKNPITDAINEIRKLAKIRGTFVESYILGSHVNGRVHGQFHLLRNDEGGTRSGRMSSSTPNLQNIPSRDDILAPLVRGLYLPDYGHKQWRKYDYSQIEYRFLIHYAVGPGADEARAKFNNEPDTDYHEMTLDMMGPVAGWDIGTPALRKKWRRPIKNINFGLIFGMGEPKLASDLRLEKAEGKKMFAAYHKAVPFAKATMNASMDEIDRTGVITTILGRKSRFDLWEPKDWQDKRPALPYEAALMEYGHIKRAYAHKALNRRLQGSAADMLKKALHNCMKAGVFDETGVPELIVHDELDYSDPGGKDEAFEETKHILESSIKLRIPVRADCDIGPDWGHAE